jgi:hypothetical protein
MSSGFNTDVKTGDRVLHVQTEDRGPAHPSIDTVVYQNGRIFYRKASSYEHFAASADFNAEDLHFRVSEQHRTVIEAIRAGELDAELAAAESAANANAGANAGASTAVARPAAAAIQVQLLNPDSWLSAGHVSLQLEVTRRADKSPLTGAHVEASIDGALSGSGQTGVCDAKGRVKIKFPMPQLGRNDLTLVIVAKSDAAKDEIRFAMRTRTRRRPVPTPQ